jgi:hypothetical protein
MSRIDAKVEYLGVLLDSIAQKDSTDSLDWNVSVQASYHAAGGIRVSLDSRILSTSYLSATPSLEERLGSQS